MTDKAQLQQWIDDYGDDSDFVRVRIKGEFPRAGSSQFIPADLVAAARGRNVSLGMYAHAPKIMGVDVARFGDDASVITFRQGLYCAQQMSFRSIDLMTLAGIVAKEAQAFKPDAIFVDGVGIGAGVVDRLRQLGLSVVDAQAGAAALNPARARNRRAEMWDLMREWLQQGAIPDDADLADDLTGLEYCFTATGALQLEKKEDAKKRGLSSPDKADSLALTFYAPVVTHLGTAPTRARTEYDVMGWA